MTEQLYVLGHPVAHSKSPAMHNAAYRALGLDWEYGFMDCPTEALASEFLASPRWLAANVTMPYKPLALAAAAQATPAARLAQGANVLVRTGQGLWADNTDGTGCVAYLQRQGADIQGARVAVCGTGPTSQAILHAALEAGAAQAVLLGRQGPKAAAAVEAYLDRRAVLGLEPLDDRLRGCSYQEGAANLAEAAVIVDATPLGMRPGDPAPFDTVLLHPGQTVLDVVYGHGDTALATAARQAGCRFLDGQGMLVAQAVETVYDIAQVTGQPADPHSVDLFAIMAQAAGFDL